MFVQLDQDEANLHYRLWEKKITFREIESESGLISTKIVNMEDKLIRQVLLVPPDDPTNSSIYKSILVATYIDALH